MKVENLRSLIRESINEYIREIDNAGNKAALEAKIAATEGAIEKREKMAAMEGIDEAYHDMLDKGKMKEIGGEVKALKKSLDKLKKQLDKLNSKSEPKTEVVADAMTEETPIEEIDITSETELEEARSRKGKDIKKAVKKDEEVLNESFLKMQKLAGVITENQYNEKKSLVENQLNEFDLNTAMKASPERHSYNDVLEVIKSYENEDMLDKFMGEFPQGKDISRDDYGRFCMSYMDDMSEQQYIQANWISITDPDIFEKAGLV
jgi:hypothetical protein